MSKHLVEFQRAIREKREIKIVMRAKADKRIVVLDGVPLDIGPRRNAPESGDLFHIWKYAYKNHPAHNVSLDPEQITKLEVKETTFEPSEVVSWDTEAKPWFFPRDWGALS